MALEQTTQLRAVQPERPRAGGDIAVMRTQREAHDVQPEIGAAALRELARPALGVGVLRRGGDGERERERRDESRGSHGGSLRSEIFSDPLEGGWIS